MKETMRTVNGKFYPLYQQFVDRKQEWIGGTLHDKEVMFGNAAPPTRIKDITLEPNGDDSAFFEVVGEDYGCGFDVRHGGVNGEGGKLTFHGYGGHKWTIEKPKEANEN